MIASESTAGRPFVRSTVSTVSTSIPEEGGRNTSRLSAALLATGRPPRAEDTRAVELAAQPAAERELEQRARGRVQTTIRAVAPQNAS